MHSTASKTSTTGKQSETGFVCMSGVVNQTGHRPLSPPAHSDNRTSQSAFGAQPARTAVSRYTFDLFECQQTFTSSVNKQNVRGNSIKCFYYFNYSSLLQLFTQFIKLNKVLISRGKVFVGVFLAQCVTIENIAEITLNVGDLLESTFIASERAVQRINLTECSNCAVTKLTN